MTDQSIEDASRKDFEAAYRKSYAYRGDKENDFQLRRNTLHPDNYYEHDVIHAWEIWQAARQSSQSEPVAVKQFAEEVKSLCNDYSSMSGNVYITDVKNSIDAMVERFISQPTQISAPQQATPSEPIAWLVYGHSGAYLCTCLEEKWTEDYINSGMKVIPV
jgi:hypothetical protein